MVSFWRITRLFPMCFTLQSALQLEHVFSAGEWVGKALRSRKWWPRKLEDLSAVLTYTAQLTIIFRVSL